MPTLLSTHTQSRTHICHGTYFGAHETPARAANSDLSPTSEQLLQSLPGQQPCMCVVDQAIYQAPRSPPLGPICLPVYVYVSVKVISTRMSTCICVCVFKGDILTYVYCKCCMYMYVDETWYEDVLKTRGTSCKMSL